MKKYVSIIFSVILFGCSADSANSEDISNRREQENSETEYTQEKDSLGYPKYYTHPELNSLSELRELLNSSDKVLGYNFNGNNANSANVECYDLYDSSGICSSAINERTLNTDQIEKLISITCDSTTFDGHWSGLAGVCFIPHLGFGFFRNDSLIAQINVCFICGGIRTRPYYKSDGLTEEGGWKYIELAEELDLKAVTGSENMSY